VRQLWLLDATTWTIEVRHRVDPIKPGSLPKWDAVVYGQGERAESRVLAGWRVSVDELLESLA
jgi:hypothetical protein